MKSILRILFVTTLAICGNIYAQSTRSLVNEGVDQYHQKKYTDAEVNFKKGLEKVPDSFQGNFNLGDAYYKQQRYDEAMKQYGASLTKTNDKDQKAKVYHNIGNTFLKQQKYKEGIESYKNSLKLNPKDEDTKYNLSYALSMLNNQQNKNDKNNKDKNKDQNKDKNQDKKDQDKKDQDKKDQDKKDQNKQDQQKQQPQDINKISKDEAERILGALKNDEKDLQKKLRKHIGVPVKTEKDW
jgi:tetratricopeptide (TPR) repeat protein